MGTATVTHDSRGNMTVDEQAKGFTWDTSNMLKQAVVLAGSVTGTAGTHLYKYDALGRRIAKTTDSTGTPFTTVYVHVGQQVFAEYQSSQPYSNPLRKYAYGSYVDEPVLLVDRTAAGAVEAGTEERLYYHRNQQYSVTALTDNSGAVVERYAYTAYGEPTILDGDGTTTRTSSAYGNPYLYTARTYDSESGLYYFRARMYEGRKGRFLGHDPIEYPDGANTYAGWMVIRMVDPNGLKMRDIDNYCQWENHHWFPQEIGPQIQAKCKNVRKFSIHHFVTPLMRCNGKYTECDAHGWLHQRRTPRYNDQMRDILNGSGNCCQFLTEAIPAMVEAYAEVTLAFNDKGCTAYRGKTYPEDFYTTAPIGEVVNTTALLAMMYQECKSDKDRQCPGGYLHPGASLGVTSSGDELKVAMATMALIRAAAALAAAGRISGGAAGAGDILKFPQTLPLRECGVAASVGFGCPRMIAE